MVKLYQNIWMMKHSRNGMCCNKLELNRAAAECHWFKTEHKCNSWTIKLFALFKCIISRMNVASPFNQAWFKFVKYIYYNTPIPASIHNLILQLIYRAKLKSCASTLKRNGHFSKIFSTGRIATFHFDICWCNQWLKSKISSTTPNFQCENIEVFLL